MISFWVNFFRAIVSFIAALPLVAIGGSIYLYATGELELNPFLIIVGISIGTGVLIGALSIGLRKTEQLDELIELQRINLGTANVEEEKIEESEKVHYIFNDGTKGIWKIVDGFYSLLGLVLAIPAVLLVGFIIYAKFFANID
tara:strand:+ start:566 stop:994 length:429 start_codon:yes stop_codon:yes gene_type:complete